MSDITNVGIVGILTDIQQNIGLFWDWLLFVNDIIITRTTQLSDLTEAAWPGYSRVSNGICIGPFAVDTLETSYPYVNPTFVNSDSVAYPYYGWGIVDRRTDFLVAAGNVGLSSIAAGAQVIVLAAYTLEEGGDSLPAPKVVRSGAGIPRRPPPGRRPR